MRASSIIAVLQALETAGVRYLVVGGLAVIAHGYLRTTRDLDLVVELAPENLERAVAALATLDYRPNVPVTLAELTDPLQRARWRAEKNMAVLQFWSEAHRQTPVDVFIEHPFDFDAEWRTAAVLPMPGGQPSVRAVSLPTLLRMKRAVARPQDLIDVEHLSRLLDAAQP